MGVEATSRRDSDSWRPCDRQVRWQRDVLGQMLVYVNPRGAVAQFKSHRLPDDLVARMTLYHRRTSRGRSTRRMPAIDGSVPARSSSSCRVSAQTPYLPDRTVAIQSRHAGDAVVVWAGAPLAWTSDVRGTTPHTNARWSSRACDVIASPVADQVITLSRSEADLASRLIRPRARRQVRTPANGVATATTTPARAASSVRRAKSAWAASARLAMTTARGFPSMAPSASAGQDLGRAGHDPDVSRSIGVHGRETQGKAGKRDPVEGRLLIRDVDRDGESGAASHLHPACSAASRRSRSPAASASEIAWRMSSTAAGTLIASSARPCTTSARCSHSA